MQSGCLPSLCLSVFPSRNLPVAAHVYIRVLRLWLALLLSGQEKGDMEQLLTAISEGIYLVPPGHCIQLLKSTTRKKVKNRGNSLHFMATLQ